ncbi:hypothetical protein G6O67_003865 [Ophiocordyceps sinensis]|uniref:SnoaL-like domain-containing protein n=2 Tax=Ophiocordyceps sinensis TaxID=72228 RepID=A0A8H4PSN7_9HYPO|nr:hypothetical protein OCS_05138 [Ophiocordyceps sinensis CO18]KAF4509723.1 hypothetical protein G6O67_003865 [Ophiocordyceps sinensis]
MPTREQQTEVRDAYLALWGGDMSLADKILDPNVKLNIDRHPAGEGTARVVANTDKDFLGFVAVARHGWEHFSFKVVRWAADDKYICVRWQAEATMGKNYKPPTSLKPGDQITWNGTDFLVLNDSNRFVEINIAQDMLELFHALGVKSVAI